MPRLRRGYRHCTATDDLAEQTALQYGPSIDDDDDSMQRPLDSEVTRMPYSSCRERLWLQVDHVAAKKACLCCAIS